MINMLIHWPVINKKENLVLFEKYKLDINGLVLMLRGDETCHWQIHKGCFSQIVR